MLFLDGMLAAGIMNVGFQVLILGLGIVFLILTMLIVFISLLNRFSSNGIVAFDKENSPQLDIEPVCDDNQTVAAITAAIYALLSVEGETRANIGFRVRSIKRI